MRARAKAEELRGIVNAGGDPAGNGEQQRTVEDLASASSRRSIRTGGPTQARTRRSCASTSSRRLGTLEVAGVKLADVDKLHRWISKTRGRLIGEPGGRRCSRPCSASPSSCGWCERNPVPRRRAQPGVQAHSLSGDELVRLSAALDTHHDQQAANIVRLLLLTGARRNEVQGARWERSTSKRACGRSAPSTKQKKDHGIPLSLAAVALLKELRADAAEGAAFVFPSWGKTGYRVEIERTGASCAR